MILTHLIALAVLQGLTEFLPISSSAHLILLPVVEGWKVQDLAFDVAVHIGTLSAVVIYFRGELLGMVRDWTRSVVTRRAVGDSTLAWAVLWGTVPVGIAGLLFNDIIESTIREPQVGVPLIASTTIIFGILLGVADWRGVRVRDEHSLNWKDVLVIGVAQAVALIPGTSRSGITMTAGLMMGLTRAGAARFSFLLSIPVIILAGGLKVVELATGDVAVVWSDLLLGAVISGVSAYLCIHFFLKLLERMGMMPFVIYRLILGFGLFALLPSLTGA
jgi:undecaprenyl-diphosphatase